MRGDCTRPGLRSPTHMDRPFLWLPARESHSYQLGQSHADMWGGDCQHYDVDPPECTACQHPARLGKQQLGVGSAENHPDGEQ